MNTKRPTEVERLCPANDYDIQVENAHNALSDCLITWGVVKEMVKGDSK